jgi:carbonic anhydrase
MSSQITTTSSPTIFSVKPNDGPTKSLVLSCIDPRFAYATEQYLYDKYTSRGQSYDHFVLAGGALGGGLTASGSGAGRCSVLSVASNWNKTLIDHVQLAITLHNVKQIEILDHLNCGAYGTCIAGVTFGPTGDQGANIHQPQYISLASNLSTTTFVSHNNIAGSTSGTSIFTGGITGGYFNGYATSPTTTLIDYGGNSILTEVKGPYTGAKVLVLGCIDPRYSSVLSTFLREYKGVKFIYDLFCLAGASIGVNQSYLQNSTVRAEGTLGNVYTSNLLATNGAGIGNLGSTWGPAFFDHLSLARFLHGITEVWVFDHLDCGAYKAVSYGDLSNPDLNVDTHIAELKRLKGLIDAYTQGADPLNTSYSVGYKGFIIDVEGNIEKYMDGNTVLGADVGITGTSGVSTPTVFIRDSSDYTKILKQARLFREFSGRASTGGSQNAFNNVFSQPVDFSIVQSNDNRLAYNLGRNVCGCTGAFSSSPFGT